VVIAGKCPDYINVNGQKKIIEFWGDRWHEGENPKDRAEIFKPYGYETLVIWGHELKDMDKLKSTLNEFCKGHQGGNEKWQNYQEKQARSCTEALL